MLGIPLVISMVLYMSQISIDGVLLELITGISRAITEVVRSTGTWVRTVDSIDEASIQSISISIHILEYYIYIYMHKRILMFIHTIAIHHIHSMAITLNSPSAFPQASSSP